jgi:hypothetical protein
VKTLVTAVVDAIKGTYPLTDRVYKYGEVPASPLTPYCIVGASLGTPRNYRAGQASTMSAHHLVVQVFAKTSDSLYDATGAVDGVVKGGKFAGASGFTPGVDALLDRDPDAGGLLGVTRTYTFTV